MSGAHRGTWLLALGLGSLAPPLAAGQVRSRGAAYALPAAAADTTRAKSNDGSASSGGVAEGAVVQGYLSSWGLPPLPGNFNVSDSGLVFRSISGSLSARAATVSLAYVDHENGRAHYIFRIDSGVFETETPGALLEAAIRPRWLERQPSGEGTTAPRSARAEPGVLLQAVRDIGSTAYADSLYQLFGQPRAPIGLIGRRGRAAGRLGEYIASRDSLALDPGHMTGVAQLRHALAHELGHRWQLKAKAQLAALWSGVPAIRDPKRYGYDDRSEHQAEAIAFA
ncbi:MAG: hypothetical protein ACJ8AP_00965, partial [Gemmatimonadales bacterium]